MRGLFLKGHARGRFKYVQFYDEHDEGTSIQRICLSNSINLDQLFRGKGVCCWMLFQFSNEENFRVKGFNYGWFTLQRHEKIGIKFLLKPATSSAKLSVCGAVSIDFGETDFLVERKMTAHS